MPDMSIALLAVLVRLPLPAPGHRVAVYVSCARLVAADREVAHNLVILRNAVHEKSKYVRVVEHPDAAVVLIEIEKYQVTPGSDDRVHHDFRGRVRLNGEWERFHAAAEPSTAEIDIALARVIEELIFIPAELRKARQSA